MLTPLRAQGKVIGLLVLGERGMQQAYAGPEMEAAHLLQNCFSPVLEAARLYERAHQHATLLNRLYCVSTMPHYAFHTAEGAADIYARVAAESTSAAAEVWFYDEAYRELRCVAMYGNEPHLTESEYLKPEHRNDWQPSFFAAVVFLVHRMLKRIRSRQTRYHCLPVCNGIHLRGRLPGCHCKRIRAVWECWLSSTKAIIVLPGKRSASWRCLPISV